MRNSAQDLAHRLENAQSKVQPTINFLEYVMLIGTGGSLGAGIIEAIQGKDTDMYIIAGALAAGALGIITYIDERLQQRLVEAQLCARHERSGVHGFEEDLRRTRHSIVAEYRT